MMTLDGMKDDRLRRFRSTLAGRSREGGYSPDRQLGGYIIGQDGAIDSTTTDEDGKRKKRKIVEEVYVLHYKAA